ncbi:uncharacterized protein [Fopius arisanus]|uniref:Uncharacterized protein n=1 Tax=Fopius arisanus TaxID=64838 RepID=A0A9R1TIN9_9HYME|nr:PREDICTED: uncharacterized protein LOC105270439 [Fopius arisanus]
MDLPETYRPSEGPENAVAQEPVVLEDYTFVPSEIGSSRAGQTSQSTISEDNSEAYTHVIGMSKKEFRAALTAKWTENRNLKNGPDVFRATFDEVVVPASVSRLDYVLALSYAMDGMMKGELLMEQSAPFAPISLSTYPS